MTRKSAISDIASKKVKLGLLIEVEDTAPLFLKTDCRKEFELSFSDQFLGTRLMVVWELL